MTEPKWTPGPWLPSWFGFQVLTGDSWNTICELKPDAEWEDGRGNYQQKYEWQRQEANARLIAAAPCLREALGPLDENYRHHAADAPEWNDSDSVQIVVTIGDLRRAHAALARAEGRQQ